MAFIQQRIRYVYRRQRPTPLPRAIDTAPKSQLTAHRDLALAGVGLFQRVGAKGKGTR
jgi:hypothetical protein